jgi:kumamolisin
VPNSPPSQTNTNFNTKEKSIMSARTVFHDSVIPLPAEPGLTPGGLMINTLTAEHPDELMNVHFSLKIASDVQAKLEQSVANGEVVPPQEIGMLYAVNQSDAEPLVSWLKANGYDITRTSRDGVYARAKASQIAKTLEVNMVPVTKNGVTYTSAQNAPSLPDEVADAVRSINGLQPFRQANKHFIRTPASPNLPHAALAGPALAIDNAPPYTVGQILKAYNADGVGIDGDGQTIAILIDTFPQDSDLIQFWAQNGLSVTMAQIDEINVGGGTLPAPSGEETLDASWTSGIAPKATIRIYASGALSFVALDTALDQIIEDVATQPGMRQLSISLGLGESFMSPGEVQTEHTKFLHLAASGVNVFVSSGDAGSNPDNTGHNPTGPLQAEYEASDPAVIGVGGTTLRLDPTGAVSSEIGWAASGGGVSRFFQRPAWQTGTGVPGGSLRLVPDVSSAADPNTGALLVFGGSSIGIGGTSWSAPVWAGFCALLNGARTKGGKPALGFLNPSLYKLIGTPAFRDITSGSNGAFNCGPGYDQVTGIGSPNVAELIARLS